MHDELGQSLAIAKIKLNAMESKTCRCNSKPEIKEVADLIGQINESVSSLCLQMSPLILYELGLAESAKWLADEMRNECGLKVDIQDDGKHKPLSEPSKTLLFCALRKLLVIMAKYADRKGVEVSLLCEDAALAMAVVCHGQGFDTLDDESQTGFSLDSIRDKMCYLGGTMQLKSLPDIGTSIILTVPLGDKVAMR
jgi:glucose-6-phosphate-specific signal transduction histidine kinase